MVSIDAILRVLRFIFKILLILAVIAGIVLLVVKFVGGVEDNRQTELKPGVFEDHVKQRVENDIEGQSYGDATQNFDDVMGEIETEAAVVLSNGKPNLDPEIKQRCMNYAFFAYVPIFNIYAQDFFSHSVWNESEINTLGKRAKDLLDMHIAEQGTADARALQKTVKTVTNYHNARQLIASADKCKTERAVDKLLERITDFRAMSPLNNNTSLMHDLTNAGETAILSYAAAINERLDAFISSYSGRYQAGEYSRYENDLQPIVDQINSFINRYSSYSYLMSTATEKVRQLNLQAQWDLI